MLGRLSGRTHRVLTGVAIAGAARAVSSVETQVTFRPLSEAEIAWYVGTGEPLDKAGAYAIQGAGGAFVERVEGSVSNVIGLPLAETLALLCGAGLHWPPGAP
jgi:septum formation protein